MLVLYAHLAGGIFLAVPIVTGHLGPFAVGYSMGLGERAEL